MTKALAWPHSDETGQLVVCQFAAKRSWLPPSTWSRTMLKISLLFLEDYNFARSEVIELYLPVVIGLKWRTNCARRESLGKTDVFCDWTAWTTRRSRTISESKCNIRRTRQDQNIGYDRRKRSRPARLPYGLENILRIWIIYIFSQVRCLQDETAISVESGQGKAIYHQVLSGHGMHDMKQVRRQEENGVWGVSEEIKTADLQLQCGLLALDAADDDVAGIFGDDFVVVKHGEFWWNC